MRNLLIKIAVPVLFGAALLAPMAAQAGPVHHHNINARWRNQEKRIYSGARTGQLTPREYHNLQVREARLRDREVLDRRHDHGHLTALQHRRLERAENRDSRAIYRDKHNHRHF